MKKFTFVKGTKVLVAFLSFLTFFFVSCEKDDSIISKPDKVSLQRINEGLPDNAAGTIPNGRSNSSTKVITGMDWTGQYPYMVLSNPALGGGDSYAFGNTIPANSKTACTVVGDFNGDGVDELIVGYNSPSGPLLINVTGPDLLLIINQFYTGSTFWTLVGVAAVDFDGDGTDELITALNSPQGPALYKGNATSIGFAKIYQGAPNALSVVAVAGGDFSGNGREELITAFNSASGPSLYRSQGADVGSSFYQGSTFWTIAGVTAADFDNNGADELITGLNSAQGPALYKGNATSIGYVKTYQGPPGDRKVIALTSGKFGSTCQMHVGFYSPTTGTTVYGNDGTNFTNLMLEWTNPSYVVKTLASGTFVFTWE